MAFEGNSKVIYVVDASSWISVEEYPDQNRILWLLGHLAEQGSIICPPESWEEIKQCEWVLAWLDQYRAKIVRNLTHIRYFALIGEITFENQSMSKPRGTRDRADQYVVAMAAYLTESQNAREVVVVTNETEARRKSRKIPHACQKRGIECISLMDMLRREFPDEEWRDE
jgi:hypothetical protein